MPWPAGGSTDRHQRALAEIASKILGQQILLQNAPGGGGTTGPGTMALNARPDGCTIAQFPMGMPPVTHMQKVPLAPDQRLHVHPRRQRLHLRLRRQGRFGVQDLHHIPFKGNADLMQAVLGGHVMAGSDASGWDRFADGGQMRLLVTFGEKRTRRWPQVPTAKDRALIERLGLLAK